MWRNLMWAGFVLLLTLQTLCADEPSATLPPDWGNELAAGAGDELPVGTETGGHVQQTGFESWQPLPVDGVFRPTHREYPVVRLTGFFQADMGWMHQSPENRAAVGDAQDGADFRRARLAAVGHVAENVGYMVEFDFGFLGRPSFMDVWLEVEDVFEVGNIRIGQFRHPIGMDGLTGVKDLTFIERALPFALFPFRQIGGMFYADTDDDRSTLAISTFRYPSDPFGGNLGDNGGYGLATRVTHLIADRGENDWLVHMGVASSYADPSDNRLQYRSQPEFFLVETGGAAHDPFNPPSMIPNFVDTGPLNVRSVTLTGGELAARYRAFHMQAEFLVSRLRNFAGDSVAFPGWYVQAAYVLTGERRSYDRTNGVLGKVVPRNPLGRGGGRGAWEVAARWSSLDLEDGPILGGHVQDLTLGVNWYLNRHTKFQLNYIAAMLDSAIVGSSHADIVVLRAQLDF